MVRKKLKFDEDAPTPVSFEEDSTQPVYEHPLSIMLNESSRIYFNQMRAKYVM